MKGVDCDKVSAEGGAVGDGPAAEPSPPCPDDAGGSGVPSLGVSTTVRQQRYRTLLGIVDDDARELGVPPRTVRRFLVLPWVGAALVAATAAYRPVFRFLTKEDRVLEWVQVLLLLAAVVAAVGVARRLRSAGQHRIALLWALFAVGCFVIAGEEVAWGQRILGLETPEALDEVNHQGQITVHNIRKVQDGVNLVFIAAGIYGCVSAVVVRGRRRPGERGPLELLTPPLFLSSLFLIVVGYKSARLLFLHEARFIVVKYGEYVEACLAAAFLAFAWYTLRLLDRRAQEPAVPD
jgi:hypothetical protein